MTAGEKQPSVVAVHMPSSLALPSGFLSRGTTLRGGAMAMFVFLYAAFFAQMTYGPPGAFTVDESLYIAMADAMATRGDLAIQENGGVDGAPSLMFVLSGYGADGRVYPQYPAGYAFIAASFYALWGVYGLFFLNALAGLACIAFVHHIASRLFNDEAIALWSAGLFAAATYFSTYAFAIWPHVLTLSLLLAAAAAALEGARNERIRYDFLALSGALIGAAALIRVDGVIFFAATFLWLRLFAAPSKRLAAAAHLAGVAPMLALAASLNFVKYGIAAPVTYSASTDYESLGGYAPLAFAAILGGAVLMAVDVSRLRAPAAAAFRSRNAGWLCAGIGVLFLILLHRPFGRFAHNLWTLLFDLQAYDGDYAYDVLVRNANGFLTTFGVPKKAFLESMPFFPLTLLTIAAAVRGGNMRVVAFCLLFAAAPITFYGLKQWHGGFSLNMRFFIPAVPFLTIASAAAFVPLLRSAPRNYKLAGLAIAAAAFGVLALQAAVFILAPGYHVAALSYPGLAAALAVTAAAGIHLFRASAGTARLTLVAASVGIGSAAASGLGDYLLTKVIRNQYAAADAYFTSVIPKGSLVVSLEEPRFITSFRNGVSLLHLDENDPEPERAVEAVNAFDRAGRCVYFYKGMVADYATESLGVPLTGASRTAPVKYDKLMTLWPVRPGCALS